MLEARRHFEQGRALFDAANYDAALAEFERAYALLANSPNQYVLLFNTGQCHERMFRYDEAMRDYRRYLAEGGADARDRAVVEATVSALEGLLATLHVEVNAPEAELWVDARRIGNAPGRVQIPGGRHVIELRARGFLPSRQEVQLPARSTRTLTFALESVGRRRGAPRGYFWTAVGLSVAAAATGGTFGILALNDRAAVDARLADPAARFEVSDEDGQRIRQYALAADIAWGATALFGVGAVVLAFLTDWSPSAGPERPATQPRAGIVPTFQGRAVGLSLWGVF